jgi:PKD repeat protein
MAFTPLQPELGFCSQFEIWRSDNLSSDSPIWQQLTAWNNEVRALVISPADQSHLWAVRDDGKICRTYNAMDSSPDWEIFSAPAATNYVAGISVYKADENIVYMFSYNDVYRSDDAGETWSNVSYDLPDINLIWIYIDDYSDDESVYVANANGVYYRNNTMTEWDFYSEGLPTIANIQDLMLFNDGSPNSVLRVSYYGKGVWESPIIQPHPIPAADFEADKSVICVNNSIQFTDLSTENTDSIFWVFEGGTPASSVEENPVVNYTLPGIFSVSLTATNSNGNDVEIKTSYITVSPVIDLPLVEGFEAEFLPENWTKRDANDDGVFWVLSDAAGGFGTSQQSAMFDNYFQDVAGARDAMVTPIYDLSLATQATLTFDVAYAMYSSEYPDTLAVLITDDCGETFTELWMKSDTALATAPPFTDDRWIPEATQWRTETLDLALWLGKEKVAIAFENRGHYGQAIYIDNVNLSGELLTTIVYENDPTDFSITVYPNPIKDIAIASVQASADKYVELNISNSIGEIVFSKEIFIAANTKQTISLDLSKLPAGAYLVNASENENHVGRMMLMKM